MKYNHFNIHVLETTGILRTMETKMER